MLRLWPDTVRLFLFQSVGWRLEKNAAIAPVCFSQSLETQDFVQQLRSLLDDPSTRLRVGSRISLTVSDTFAKIVAMPWQPALRRSSEVDLYAQACFQQIGITVGNGWAMYSEFRKMGTMGIAYAFPDALLEAVLTELAHRNLVLVSIQPLSAEVYFRANLRGGSWPAVINLREYSRISALVFSRSGLIGYEVEEIIGSAEASAVRIGRRIAAQFGDISRTSSWYAHGIPSENGPAPSFGMCKWKIENE